MSERPILLKLLFRERHWQNYGTFCTEYDKAAARIDPDLAGSCPSRAQLHRWLTGSLRSLPYPDHCRVLQEIFREWSAEQLFQPAVPGLLQPDGRSPGQRANPDVPDRRYSPRRQSACGRSSSRPSPASTSPSTSPASPGKHCTE